MIKNNKTGQAFIGLTTSTNNMLYWLLRKSKENGNYKRLAESVKQYGISNHSYVLSNKVFDDKRSGEDVLRTLQINLEKSGKSLNDSIVETERYQCEKCGMTLKKCYQQKHDDVYCKQKANDFIDSLLIVDPE